MRYRIWWKVAPDGAQGGASGARVVRAESWHDAVTMARVAACTRSEALGRVVTYGVEPIERSWAVRKIALMVSWIERQKDGYGKAR